MNDIALVPAEFHPQKDAVGREYIFRIAVFDDPKYQDLCQKHHPTHIMNLLPITELYRVLPLTRFNYDKAQEAINMLNGEHDFASFCIKQENIPDTVRDISITITKPDPLSMNPALPHPYSIYEIQFKSRSFLYNQVRLNLQHFHL